MAAQKSTGRLRIVAGKWRGRWIDVPSAAAVGRVRPVTTRVREAIFSALATSGASRFENMRVLDLFAGSGSSGLEALSRGAQHATFVERDAQTAACLTKNIVALSAANCCCVLQQDACLFVQQRGRAYDLIFVDPPYPLRLPQQFWQQLSALLQPQGLAVLRCHKESPFALPDCYKVVWQRNYGDMMVLFVGVGSGTV
ncbi:MAG: 16S rRNA (guanine(966)-N(2))-methyltransferase RsmD [Myxococcota bacterium]